jgi:hypothetical protein
MGTPRIYVDARRPRLTGSLRHDCVTGGRAKRMILEAPPIAAFYRAYRATGTAGSSQRPLACEASHRVWGEGPLERYSVSVAKSRLSAFGPIGQRSASFDPTNDPTGRGGARSASVFQAEGRQFESGRAHLLLCGLASRIWLQERTCGVSVPVGGEDQERSAEVRKSPFSDPFGPFERLLLGISGRLLQSYPGHFHVSAERLPLSGATTGGSIRSPEDQLLPCRRVEGSTFFSRFPKIPLPSGNSSLWGSAALGSIASAVVDRAQT